MNRAISALLLFVAACSSHAALLGRLPTMPGGTDYQAYYDTDLDVTWLADASLAASENFGVSVRDEYGSMSWANANLWLTALNDSTYLGKSDWRLPRTAQPDPSCTEQIVPNSGYNCIHGELGHMFYTEFGGAAGASLTMITGTGQAELFSNLLTTPFYTAWTGESVHAYGSLAHGFTGGDSSGRQMVVGVESGLSVWALRDGDIAPVPLPAVGWLLVPAFGAIGAFGVTRRRPR